MPATNHHVDRLSLTFRVEDPAPARSSLPGGWWLWCLLGIAVGLSGWLLSRQYLADKLGERLLASKSRPEAILALEGLLLLDSTASHAIVGGLQHEDFAVARAAFRAIETQIDRWQELTPAVAKTRMQTLVDSMLELPETIPSENRILASSLASRVFTLCLEREDEDMKPVMLACEQVIQRCSTNGLAAQPEERIASLVDSPNEFSLSDDSVSEPSSATIVDPQDASTSEYTQDFSMPLTTPPPPLPPDASESVTRGPQPIDVLDHSSLPIDSSQPLSSTGRRASLRLVNSPVRIAPTERSTDDAGSSQRFSDSRSMVLPPEQGSYQPQAPEETQLSSETNLRSAPEPDARTLDGIEKLPIQELVRLLGSIQPKVAQAASLTLRRHGMSDSKLELAMQLATGSEQRRLEIIDQFPTRTDIDPRVWLIWMAQDGNPKFELEPSRNSARCSITT